MSGVPHSTPCNRTCARVKHDTLDTLIAVGDWDHSHVELFTLSRLKWQKKNDYPYWSRICLYSILAFEKKFIVFGGMSANRKVLKNKDITRYEKIEI